jgi:fused signal recognition particle receptor
MDSAVYIVIALVVAVVLFFVLGKRSPTATSRGPNVLVDPAEKAASGEPSTAQVEAPSIEGEEVARHRDVVASDPTKSVPPTHADSREPSRTRAHASPSEVRELQRGLSRARSDEGLFGRLKSLLQLGKEISPELVAEIEEVLLGSDVGVATTQTILASVKEQLSRGELRDESAVWAALRSEAVKLLNVPGVGELGLKHKPTVVLFVGVNGAGKTTTIGKLATKLKAEGKTCVLAAGDTFRAAAVQQLTVWGQRVGCEVVRGKDGADPGSVIFEAVKRAQEIGADVVLADTAGRLHTKANLMAEMAKIARTTEKAQSGAPHEVLLVIDSTNGQNAFAQAKEFKESLELSGIVLTKLDGTAKGGVILGIADALRLPVRYVGLGERPDDLHAFAPGEFVEALLGKEA